MQNRRISPALLILSISLIVIGVVLYLNFKNSESLNDNKSKLTLLNLTKTSAQKIPMLKTLIAKNLSKQNEIAEEQVSNQNVLTAERVYTEMEINEMTEEKFIELLKDTERRLPKLSDIKQLPPGALHRTPPIVIEAGRDLGVIKEVLKIHESFEREAAHFYKNCAQSNSGVTPVRALCLTNLIMIKKKNNENLNLNDYPIQLIELSKMITDL